jgi:hypothetical protein
MAIHKARDNSFKLILGNHELFSAFLRNFIPIESLRNVRPEDIEDITERFLPLFQENRDSDTVKRITLRDPQFGDLPVFFIAIVEHESSVNFRAPFKMLQYVTLVLDNWEKEVNQKHPGISETKDFRYPPVFPIVFYDGETPWTAERNFRSRTAHNDIFAKYIPSFEYELVNLNTYSREDLLDFKDPLSLVMLIDKIRDPEGIELLNQLSENYFEELALKIPPGMGKLLSDVITALLNRVEAPRGKIAAITDRIEKKEYQTMFEGFVEAVLTERRLGQEEGIQIGAEKAREEEREKARERAYQEKLESARKLKARGFPADAIAESLDLSLEVVENL